MATKETSIKVWSVKFYIHVYMYTMQLVEAAFNMLVVFIN